MYYHLCFCKGYILENTTDLSTSSLCGTENDDQAEGSTTSSQTNTCCPSVLESEPPGLDHGWPAEDWSYRLQGEPSVEVYFQSDRAAGMKDLLREFISKATMVRHTTSLVTIWRCQSTLMIIPALYFCRLLESC